MREYFCGWYFKCQSEEHTLAVIVSTHKSEAGSSAAVQLITENGAWCVPFPYESFSRDKGGLSVRCGGCRLGTEGMRLCLSAEGLSAIGYLRFGPLSPLRYDIMGPFKYLPFMECRHTVVSMRHTVNGEVWINGEHFVFKDALGYIEGDRGRSFPREYAWSHAFAHDSSIMLSVAEIPLCVLNFTGIIAAVHHRGTEYRLATYLGARLTACEEGKIVISQRELTLTAHLLEKRPLPLKAPVRGEMTRTIHESAACRAYYRLEEAGEAVLEFESDSASFEYELSR